MLSYLSPIKGSGGEIKKGPSFVVEEIDLEGRIYTINIPVPERWIREEKFSVFVLQKTNWTTQQALAAVAKSLGIGKKRISAAGTKDRAATTTQLCSVYKMPTERIKKVKIKDIKILGAWYWDKPIKMGDLLGNRFQIEAEGRIDTYKIYDIYSDLGGIFPNYFGPQRFGTRKNTHIVGRHILNGDIKGAVFQYLTYIDESEREEIKKARKELSETGDFNLALKNFPKHLKYERTLLSHLSIYQNDFVGALKKLRTLTLMFIHGYQAFLFNKSLSERIKEGFVLEEGEYNCAADWYSFPDITRINGKFPVGKIIGYETNLNERENELLKEEGISQEEFKIKSFPELSSRGGYRPQFAPFKNFSFKEGSFSFELPAGTYATSALREFLDEDKKE